MAYKSDGGPKGEQSAKDRKAGDVGAKGGIGGGKQGGSGNDRGGDGMSSSDQRHRNRQAEIERVAKATDTSTDQIGNSGVSQAGKVASAAQGMSRDYRDIGNTPVENAGNLIGGLLGLGERRPTLADAKARVEGTPPGQVTDHRADWGFDVIGALASFAGLATGLPVGTAYNLGKWALGVEPPTLNLGPDVLSLDNNRAPATAAASKEKSNPSQQGGTGNGGRGNGLLPQKPTEQAVKPPTSTPTTPPPDTTPPVQQGPSHFPTPTQRFNSVSYQGVGDWLFDPETQQVKWQQRPGNGLLPFVAA